MVLLMCLGCKTRVPKPDHQPTTTTTPTNNATPAGRPASPSFPYRASETKTFDLIHTRLSVSFDWEKEQMKGEATLTLRPWFAAADKVEFDAKGFIIHQVALKSGNDLRKLKYDYDNEKLSIQLDRSYAKEETLSVYIDYTARPSELASLVSEEAAEDQGLYFINARGETAGKPRQIWTQGESHGSPAWFPTFDTPNQRCTDEIFITVADSFKTLSNGLLVDSHKNTDGSRTDHWRMDLPHAPYLFMMAIGNYAIVKDQWRGREVSYYVEPDFERYAKMVFGNTPEMIEFFSTRLGVDYAWPKYSQVVVRDFVSGAMENTSATTHYGRLQHDAREHLDNTEEDIISHELFHQWFGDLVTCESWANLSLNEGFATYGEYLWIEHKYGADQAQEHLLDDRRGYLRSASRGIYPIIRYHHQSADAMFDAHSYAKGGQVLHMLRTQVGDDAFFAALKRYLTVNAFDDVEIHKLRLAFEEVTGQDLNWFFDQWFLQAGHPELELTHDFHNGKYTLRVQQVQDFTQSPVFRIPVALDYVVGTKHKAIQVWMETADTTFEFDVNAAPTYVSFDPERSLLCNVRKVSGMDAAAWTQQLKSGKGFGEKAEAVTRLSAPQTGIADVSALTALAKNAYRGTRLLALTPFVGLNDAQQDQVLEMALQLVDDPEADVRSNAIAYLGDGAALLQTPARAAIMAQAITRLGKAVGDSSYSVSRLALENIFAIDSAGGRGMAEQLMNGGEKHLSGSIARILRESNSDKALPYVLEQLRNPAVGSSVKTSLLRGFGGWLKDRNVQEQQEGAAVLKDMITNNKERWLRFFAVQSLSEMGKNEETTAFFKKLQEKEGDEFVKSAIDRYLKQ